MATFDGLRRQLAVEARARCDRATDAMTAELKRTAPVSPEGGELKRKTGVEVRSETPRRITALAEIDVDYAVFVVNDTRPHIIRPRSKKALAFNWPKAGGMVIFSQVMHPGTTANEFFDRVVNNWGEYLRRAA